MISLLKAFHQINVACSLIIVASSGVQIYASVFIAIS
jgi:hypothetical protein